MSYIPPLSPLDFLSRDQLRQYVANRRADAISREAAHAPEGRGLVHIKTTGTPVKKTPTICQRPSCETGVPQPHEWGCSIPTKTWPVDENAIEIDQQAMRLRRLKKNVITTARMHSRAMQNRQHHALMVTLTYRPGVDWQPEHVSEYIRRVRQWYKRKGHTVRYVWVLELTKAGRPHYHCLFWHPAGRGLSMPKADRRGWWPHGMTRTERARNAVGYLAKYASKGSDDVMPKGARLYGVGGLSMAHRLERAWWNLPVTVRRWGFPADRWRRASGGGWVCRATGEHRDPCWRVILHGYRVFVVPRQQPMRSPFDELLSSLACPWQRMPI